MDWDVLSIYICGKTVADDSRLEPMESVDVTFILMNEDDSIQYSTVVSSNTQGYAVLENTSTVIYSKSNFNVIEENIERQNSIVTNKDADFSSIVKWYAIYDSGDRGTASSQVYYLNQEDPNSNEGDITYVDRVAQATNPTGLSITTLHVTSSQIPCQSEVGCYFYDENGTLKATVTGNTNSNGVLVIPSSQFGTGSVKVKLAAFSEANSKCYISDTTYIFENLNVNTSNQYVITIYLYAKTSIDVRILNISNYDMIQKMFTRNYSITSWVFSAKTYNDNTLYSTTVNASALTGVNITITGSPAIPKLKIYGAPSNSTNYYSGFTVVDLIKCPYFNVETFGVNSSIYLPNKKLIVENPIVLDTVTYNLSTPIYNLPSVDMQFSYTKQVGTGYQTVFSFTGNSSYSSTTINIPATIGNIENFLKTLIGEITNEGYITAGLSKHHYVSCVFSHFYISAITHVDGIEVNPSKLYFCKNKLVNGQYVPVAGPYFQGILREQYVCFRRKEFSDYTKGFDYTYKGSSIQSGQIFSAVNVVIKPNERGTYPGVSGFSLPDRTKIISATREFFSACSYNTYPKLNDFTTTQGYVSGFVGTAISRPEYYTNYTEENNSYQADYNLNGHCYTNYESAKRTFEPVLGDDYPYLEFYVLNTTGTVTLNKVGTFTPTTTLQYSYWGFNWKDYTIGTTLTLTENSNIRFRNSHEVTSFSINSSNYYHFDIEGSQVYVKGHLSSLINPSANGLTVTGTYSFFNLFRENSIFDAHGLILDSTQVSNFCYQDIFRGCTNLISGPTLETLTGGIYCFAHAFSGCTALQSMASDIKLKTYNEYCCVEMFEGCTSLVEAPGLNYNLNSYVIGRSAFGNMFRLCTSLTGGPNVWRIGSSDVGITYLNQDSCYGMFLGCSNLKKMPSMEIRSVGISACYAMFSGCSKLETNNFSMSYESTTSNVGISGCAYMFNNCIKLTNPTNFQLNAKTLSDCAYLHMFDGCSFVVYAPEIKATIIPNSGCAYMYSRCFSTTTVTSLQQFVTTELTTVNNFGMAYMFYDCAFLDFTPIKRTLKRNGNNVKIYPTTPYTIPSNVYGSDIDSWGPSTGTIKTWYDSNFISNYNVFIGYKKEDKSYYVGYYFHYTITVDGTLNHIYTKIYVGRFADWYPYYACLPDYVEVSNYSYEYEYFYLYLNATNLNHSCYAYMFSKCPKLHYGNHIILNANNLAENCYGHMFENCHELVSIPICFSGITSYAESACQYMFAYCSFSKANNNLKPTSTDYSWGNLVETNNNFNWIAPSNSLSYESDYYIHNVGLRSIQKDYNYYFDSNGNWSFPNIYIPDNNYSFENNTGNTENVSAYSWNIIKGYVNSTNSRLDFKNAELKNACFSHMFYGCSGLVYVNSEIKTTKAPERAYEYMFCGCHALKGGMLKIGENLTNSTTAETYSFRNMFKDCFELRGNCIYNSELMPLSIGEGAYLSMYKNCFKLIKGPAIKATTVSTNSCNSMFSWCIRLTGITNNILPATQLATSCYYSMFSNCGSLINAPGLPATNLVTNCYSYMFNSCNFWYFTGYAKYSFTATTVVPPSTAHGYVHLCTISGTEFTYNAYCTTGHNITDTYEIDYFGSQFHSGRHVSDNGENDAVFQLSYAGGSVGDDITPYSSLPDYYIPYNYEPMNQSDMVNTIDYAVNCLNGSTLMVSKYRYCQYRRTSNGTSYYLYVYDEEFYATFDSVTKSFEFSNGRAPINSNGNEDYGYDEFRGPMNKTTIYLNLIYNQQFLMGEIPVQIPIFIDESQFTTLGTQVASVMVNYYYEHATNPQTISYTYHNMRGYYSKYNIRMRYQVNNISTGSSESGWSVNYQDADRYYSPYRIRDSEGHLIVNWFNNDNNDYEYANFYIPIADMRKNKEVWNIGLTSITISATTLNSTYSNSWANMLNLKNGVLHAKNLTNYTNNSIHSVPGNWTIQRT